MHDIMLLFFFIILGACLVFDPNKRTTVDAIIAQTQQIRRKFWPSTSECHVTFSCTCTCINYLSIQYNAFTCHILSQWHMQFLRNFSQLLGFLEIHVYWLLKFSPIIMSPVFFFFSLIFYKIWQGHRLIPIP